MESKRVNMDSEAVLEFLGHIPLLQRLPSSSINKIAQFVQTKHYNQGERVVREGDNGDGIYFIWDGEAKIYGCFNVDEESRSELHLKQYDYFGYGTVTFVHEADVIALSELTCLVLPKEYICLMKPKSIWNADDTQCSLLERILQLDPVEVNIFRGFTLPDTPRSEKVFGGQFIGQALAAASKTVDSLKFVHSLHNCFLLGGDLNMPIVYQVHRLRDGNSFATRRVDATQQGNIVFTLLASFQKEEKGFEHQEVTMPSVRTPEMLLSMEELREKRPIDPCLSSDYQNKATEKFIPSPVEIKFCEPNLKTNKSKTSPSAMFWFRAKGKLSDDQALHRCAVAYICDLIFIQISLNPHRRSGLEAISLSLDHSMWFHRPCRADEWLLHVIDSPSSSNARGFCFGRMFNRNGELVVSLIQEGLIRKVRPPRSVSKSKL